MVSFGTPANSEIRTVLYNQYFYGGHESFTDWKNRRNSHTRGHKKGVSLLGIGMGRLPALQLVKSCAADFPSLNSRLTERGQILAGTDIVVNTQTDLGATVAHQAKGPDPVCDQEAGGVVCGCLAGGGAEADGCQEGTVVISSIVSSYN